MTWHLTWLVTFTKTKLDGWFYRLLAYIEMSFHHWDTKIRDELDFFEVLKTLWLINSLLVFVLIFLKNSQTDDDRTIFLTNNRSRSPDPLILSVKLQKTPTQIQTFVLKATKKFKQNWFTSEFLRLTQLFKKYFKENCF